MIFLAIATLTLMGGFLRLVNISPFKFYPDAFVSLIVAENISKYHSVVGFLGEHGQLFPDYVSWTRAGYPLLIDLMNLFLNNEVLAASLVALLAGVAAVPVAYFQIKTIFDSRLTGLVGALLIAISFNHTVWGGFILTETTAVLIILIFLLMLYLKVDKKSEFGNFYDLVTGAVLGFGFLTRFEYLAWLLPVTFLIFKTSPTPKNKLINLLIGFFLIVAIFINQLFPISSALQTEIFLQVQDNLNQLAIFTALAIMFAVLQKRAVSFKQLMTFPLIQNLLVIFTWVLVVYLFSPMLHFQGFISFFKYDFVISIASIIGLTLMLKNKHLFNLAIFIEITLVLFLIIYYRINPTMQRYLTHLIPVLLIPASYGVAKLFSSKAPLKLLILIILVIQTIVTYNGIRFWDQGAWFRKSYEEKSAQLLMDLIKPKGQLLLVSFPESYYFDTKLSTYSLTNDPPYIYIGDSLNDEQVLIVEDMGMRDQFPKFAEFLDQNLVNYRIGEYRTSEVYHYANRSLNEVSPVIIYQIKLAQLKSKIRTPSLLQNSYYPMNFH